MPGFFSRLKPVKTPATDINTPISRSPSSSPVPSIQPEPAIFEPSLASHRSTSIFGTDLEKSIAIAHIRLDSKDFRGEHREWGFLPLVLAKTGSKVKQYASAEGLFQRQVSQEHLQELQALFETPPKYGKKVKWDHFPPREVPHLAAALFVHFLKSLPTPLLPDNYIPEFVDAHRCAEQAGSRVTHLRYVDLLRNLPYSSMYVLLYVLDLLDYISRQGNADRKLLARIFTPIILKPPTNRSVDLSLIEDTLEYLSLQRDFDWTILGLSHETPPHSVDPSPESTPVDRTPMIASTSTSNPELSTDQEADSTPSVTQGYEAAREEFARAGMSAPTPSKPVTQKLLLSPPETTRIPDISSSVNRTSENIAARGGFYAVYRGHHNAEGEVALRLPLPKYEVEALERRFWREAEIWYDLRHKHIACLLGTFHDDLGHYMVSPWMNQGNVMSCIQRGLPFDPVKALRGIADAIVYLHGKGYTHGDLKMENVLLSEEGDTLLTDFGLTRHLETVVTSSTVTNQAGNFRWFAPEIAQGGPKSKEGDIYAFGMMIAEALTRRIPLWELTTVYQLLQALMANVRPLKSDILEAHAPPCSEGLWKLAEECWNLDSALRPSAAEVATRLDRLGDML
ncbi:hypothetical protein FRB96_008018 [Tulasnella sp. 330]|nr:hypothetical protein FRB96_008018 [Tulasnella sp. 330]KAG8871253.1 hypothetical protein FRB97_008861 [Tulasnella sp. 331]KAG8877948.1 hypothetical protein FRB98_006477 [Tulasnella sp. 332]